MKKSILYISVSLALLFTACKKEGQTIINNYNNNNGTDAPKRKMMVEYGDADGIYTLKFSYYKDEIGKLQELTSYSSGVASSKFIVLYNNDGNATGYQSYSLPANTLTSQGTFTMDNQHRVTKIVNREVNADTISIVSIKYTDLDYQPTSYNYYDKSQDQITRYSYFTYDSKGNLYNQIDYELDGSALYKRAEVTTSGFTEAINPLNQLYYYLAVNGPNTTASQYFSNYFGGSSRTQRYKPNGTNDGVDIFDYSVETDDENFVTKIFTGAQDVVITYK